MKKLRSSIVATILFTILQIGNLYAQSPWPSGTWANAVNLTSIMDVNGLTDVSGLHWNPDLNRLFLVQDNSNFRVLELNTGTNTFTQIGNLPLSGGPEDITQVDYKLNEFYTIDENDYKIKKYTYTANFSTLIAAKSWNLLNLPSPMTNTGNTGPEGITFVPDKFLSSAGFICQSTGQLYTSIKGMGGLLFVAHQDLGYIWVFDVNPTVTDDFAYVGKYQTNRDESCDLEFDRSTGLLYILHNTWKSNPDNNYLEVTDLKSSVSGNIRKFNTLKEYTIANPSSNSNIEGFAISPKCPDENNVSVWLCRDVETNGLLTEQNDCIRWFKPFVADGNCNVDAIFPINIENRNPINIFPNPGNQWITLSIPNQELKNSTIKIYNSNGQTEFSINHIEGKNYRLDASKFKNGMYLIEIRQEQTISTIKWLKN